VCEDRGIKTRYIYENKDGDHLSKYSVDGGLIADNGAKCDFLLLNCDKQNSYFIELKGSDIIRAIEQINRSIDVLRSKLTDFSVFGRIILTRVNTIEIKDIRYFRLQKRLKQLQGDLLQRSRELREMS
jgi:hypothetical protein